MSAKFLSELKLVFGEPFFLMQEPTEKPPLHTEAVLGVCVRLTTEPGYIDISKNGHGHDFDLIIQRASS